MNICICGNLDKYHSVQWPKSIAADDEDDNKEALADKAFQRATNTPYFGRCEVPGSRCKKFLPRRKT